MSTNSIPRSDGELLTPFTGGHKGGARGHAVQFYTNDAFLLDGLGRFIGTALEAGAPAIVVATKAHRRELVQHLQARGLDVALALKQGRYVELDAAGTLRQIMRGGKPDEKLFDGVMAGAIASARSREESGHSRVAIFGEMVALLWAEGNAAAAVRLEQLWNSLARRQSFSLRCAYPMTAFNRSGHDESFSKICAEHSAVLPAEGYTALADDDERLRTITQLQQKAEALKTEAAERREAQKLLQRREAELSDFLGNAVEGIQQVGADQRIRWANKSLLSLLGYTPQEYVGHRVSDFHVHGEVFRDFWEKLMRQEELSDFPADLRCKDGSIKHVLIHCNGFWDSGRFAHTRCFVRDVTAQRRTEQELRMSQERLKLTQQAARIGSWEMDVESEACVWSQEAADMLGLEFTAGSWQDILGCMYYSGDRESFKRSATAAINRNRNFECEFRITPHGQQVRWLSARGRAFYNQGRPLLLGVLIDVTANKLAERKKASRRKAAAASAGA